MINNVFATGHNRSKLHIIVTETKFVGISFDYIYTDYTHIYIYLQRAYLQIYLANNIAEINYLWRMPWMNDKIMIIIYSNPIRAYSDYCSKSHEWHNAKLTACWKYKLILVSFHENRHYLYCWQIASITFNIFMRNLCLSMDWQEAFSITCLA